MRYPLISICLSWSDYSPLVSTWKRYATTFTMIFVLESYTNPVSLSSAKSAQFFKH